MPDSSSEGLTLNAKEVELIREIASDWLIEGIVLPPFDSELSDLLMKLGLLNDEPSSERYPKTQERLSRHGVRK